MNTFEKKIVHSECLLSFHMQGRVYTSCASDQLELVTAIVVADCVSS